jgi:MoxR-like ATPase
VNQALSESELHSARDSIQRLRHALGEVLFGQDVLIDQVIVGLLARGHLLLEGLPGLGKTELVKGLSKALNLDSKRVQFTPDLLPGDITGNPMLHETPEGRRFVFQPGPLFASLVLADEINRASPKTQSALLEAMQERRVTVMGESHSLPEPFFVLATQNPIELEGTYPLPEAQLDRFLFKLDVRSTDAATLEKIVLHRELGVEPEAVLAAYRVGDSPMNAITPLNAYFALVVGFMQRYDRNAGVGTVVALMLPYVIWMFVAWTTLFAIWKTLGLPWGIS